MAEHPNEITRTAIDPTVDLVGSLSPSRAADFRTCPLRYRFRVLDKLPERSSPAAVRGTLVHAVLERLFDLPAADRTPAAASALVPAEWQRLARTSPEIAELYGSDVTGELPAMLAGARRMLAGYFALEDPRLLEPLARESRVEVVLSSGLQLRGCIDRLDPAIGGDVRVVDYKTGRLPGEAYEAAALFQLKFYALMLWRTRGEVPTELRLLYLNDTVVLTHHPDAAELAAFERLLGALWRAIARATATGDFRPRRGTMCSWCDHQVRCPEWGGTPPPLARPQPSQHSDVLATPRA